MARCSLPLPADRGLRVLVNSEGIGGTTPLDEGCGRAGGIGSGCGAVGSDMMPSLRQVPVKGRGVLATA
jgi:hypothetical protein